MGQSGDHSRSELGPARDLVDRLADDRIALQEVGRGRIGAARLWHEPAPLTTVLFGERRGAREPGLARVPRPLAAARLVRYMAPAHHLPQTKAYFFRREARHLARLCGTLLARARRAVSIAATTACYRFSLTEDAARNARFLHDALQDIHRGGARAPFDR